MANARLKLARVKTRKRRRNDAGSEEELTAEVPVPLSRSNSQNCVQEEPEMTAVAGDDDVATALFDRKTAIETRLSELSLGKPLARLEEKGFDVNGVRLKRLHRDFLLQEMEWMAADFSQERKWRMKTARTLAGSVASHHAKKASRSARQEKQDEDARRRTAARVGREVKKFWTKIDKIISFKVKLQSDELRKAAMDRHLKSLMAQTERYASALALAFCDAEPASVDDHEAVENGGEAVVEAAIAEEMKDEADEESDSDFDGEGEDEDDDETTIAAEEAVDAGSLATYEEEIATLRDESEMSLDELRAKYALMETADRVSDDSDFDMEGSGESDDETTIAREEMKQSRRDVDEEITRLQEESELSIEELLARYTAAASSPGSESEVSESVLSDEDEFRPPDTEEVDDETTLEIAESTEFTKDEVNEEVRLLQDESELSIDELRARYAAMEAEVSDDEADVLSVNGGSRADGEVDSDADRDSDSEFEQNSTDEEDDETTIAEAERFESHSKEDVDGELLALEEDNNLTVEELRARYYQDAASIDDEQKSEDVEMQDECDDTTDQEAQLSQENSDGDDVMEIDSVSTYKRPFLLTSRLELREYQQAGVNWLVSMCEKRINGILADEMGLGKTIQTITMLAHLACARGVWGPHLIVVPTSCMVNWEMEFKRWCPAFKVLTYFGSAKRRKELRHGWSKLNAFHVCITSYQLVVQDAHCFKRKKWYYLILDEAHNIKNWKSLRWQTLLHFNSQRRLLLTGTPLQNNIMELWALMHFLMPHVFASRKEFTYWFQNPLSVMVEESTGATGSDPDASHKLGNAEASPDEAQQQQLVAQLHGIIRPFVLRRLKKDVAKQLPGKFEHVISCSLSKRQRFLYEDFISRSSTKRALFGSSKSSGSGNFMSMMNVLMQLRKVCNHPDLFEPRPIASPLDMEPLTLKLPMRCAYIVDWLEPRPISWWPSSMSLPNQELCGCERFTSLRARKLLHFYDDVNLVDDKLPSECSVDTSNHQSKRPDVLRRLLHLAQARRSYWIEKRRQHETLARVATSLHEPMLGSDLIRACTMPVFISHAMEVHRKRASGRESLSLSDSLSAIVRDPIDRVDELQPIVRKAVCAVPKARAGALSLQLVGQGFSADTNSRDPAKLSRKVRIEEYVEEQLKPIATRCLDPFYESFKRTQLFFPDKRLIQFDCGKLQQLDLLLRKLKRGKHRCLIFTQMSSMLNILEIFLNLHGHTYFRLDGSTKVETRQYLMEKFNHDDKIFCFILSTRSGGLGINLTGADSVIFYDSDWNPAMDAQAQDRAHRIGQTRDVHIYRLVSEHTVEENILKKAQQKRHLDFLVMAKGQFTTEFFSKANLRELMGELDGKSDGLENEGTAKIEEVTEEDAEIDEEEVSLDAIESAMAQLEDEDDVVAMRGARDEFLSEQREFDEEVNAVAAVGDKRRVSNAGTDVSRVSTPTAGGENDEEPNGLRGDHGEDAASSGFVSDSSAPVPIVEKDVGAPKRAVGVDDEDTTDVVSVEQDASVVDEEEDDGDYTGQCSDVEEEEEDDEDDDEESGEDSEDDISDAEEDARPAKRRSKSMTKNHSGKRKRGGSTQASGSAAKRSKQDQSAINAAQEQKKQEKAKERAREVEEERKLQAWKDSVSSLQHFEDSLNPVDRYALHFREDVDPLYAYVPTAEAYAQLEDDSKLLLNIEEIEAQKMVEEQQWIDDGELIAGVSGLDELSSDEIEMYVQLYKKERSNVHAFHRQRQLTGEAWEMRKCAITGQLFYFNADTREATWDKPVVLTKNEQVETARAGGFADLPASVLLLIFSKLRAYPDRLKGVEFVCRSWRDAARNPSLCHRVNASDFYRFQSGGGDGRGHWLELLQSVDRGETLLFGSGVYEIDDVVKIDKPIRLLAAHDAHVELEMASPRAQIQWSARGGVFCGFHVSRRHRYATGGSVPHEDEPSAPASSNWQHLLHVTQGGYLRAVFNDFDGNHQGNACLAVSGDPQSLLVLQHNRIFHAGSGSGVVLLQGALVMQRNSVFQNAHSGITVWSGNAVLRRNQILGNKRFGIRLLYHANNVVIEENKVEGHACGNIDVENSGRRFVVRWNEMLKDEVENLPHSHGSVRLRTSRVEERVVQVAKPAQEKVVTRRPKVLTPSSQLLPLPLPRPTAVLVSAAMASSTLNPIVAAATPAAAATVAMMGATPASAQMKLGFADTVMKTTAAAIVAATTPRVFIRTVPPTNTPGKVNDSIKVEAGLVGGAHRLLSLPQSTESAAGETKTLPTPTQTTSDTSPLTPAIATTAPATVVAETATVQVPTPAASMPASRPATLPATVSATASALTSGPVAAPSPATGTAVGQPATVPAPVKMRRKRKPKTEKVLVHGVELVFRDTCEKKGEKKVKRPRLKSASTPQIKTENALPASTSGGPAPAVIISDERPSIEGPPETAVSSLCVVSETKPAVPADATKQQV